MEAYTQTLIADNKILLHKLDDIRSYVEDALSSEVDGDIVCNVVLSIISRYENVPSDWKLSRKLVSKELN